MRNKKQAPDLLSREYWNGTIKMSLSKFFILSALDEKPLHGYDIASEVERKTDGCCSPKEGTIYPVLKQFAEGGYVTFEIEVVSGRERKVYSITDKGREAFKIGLQEWMAISKSLACCVPMADN